MKSFFPMVRAEGAALVFLIAFAAFAFIPAWRDIEVGGMAVFGWLIAALMLISPAVTLAIFLRRGGGGADGAREPGNGSGHGNGGRSGNGGGSGPRDGSDPR